MQSTDVCYENLQYGWLDTKVDIQVSLHNQLALYSTSKIYHKEGKSGILYLLLFLRLSSYN